MLQSKGGLVRTKRASAIGQCGLELLDMYISVHPQGRTGWTPQRRLLVQFHRLLHQATADNYS